MIQWIYQLVMMRLNVAKRLIIAERPVEAGSFTKYISTEDIIKRSGIWDWLAKRAMRSQTKRNMDLV